jgi:hypothetical protein
MLRGLNGNAYEAIILAKLLSFYKYFYDTKMLTFDGYFYQTIEDLENLCGISECRQRSALRELECRHLLSIKIAGSPPRRYFKLHTDAIVALMESPINKEHIDITKGEKKAKQVAFYKKLNPALVFSWEVTKECGGRIPRKLLWFMFVWQYYMRVKGGFEWNSALYGELRTYWRARHTAKLFDYKVLQDFMSLGMPKTIYNFINYDRKTTERPPSERLYYYNFDIEGERYEE